MAARPDVYNHNLETVPRLYRPGAAGRALLPLAAAARAGQGAGPGHVHQVRHHGRASARTRREVLQVMDDMRAADVDFLTIGQYLQPTPRHHAVDRFVTPAGVRRLQQHARGKGFLMVSASPLTRSSYHAGDDFARLRAARDAQLHGPPPRPDPSPIDADPRRAARAALSARAAVRPGRRHRALSRIPALVRRRAHPRAREADLVVADLVIGFKMFRERFTSRVQARSRRTCGSMWPTSRARSAISTTTGSLRAAADGGCRIDFYVDFEFRSAMLQKAHRRCCSTRRCGAWSRPSRPARASSTATARRRVAGLN